MRVRATKMVFYGGSRHVPGQKTEFFTIADEPRRPLRPTDNEITKKLAVDGTVPRDWSQSSMAAVDTADVRGMIQHEEPTPSEERAEGNKGKGKKKPTGDEERI